MTKIDQQIDAIHKQIRNLERIKPTPDDWQRAWDRHPDLRQRELELWKQRGIAQIEHDLKAAATAFGRFPQPKPLKKCPTCKMRTLAA